MFAALEMRHIKVGITVVKKKKRKKERLVQSNEAVRETRSYSIIENEQAQVIVVVLKGRVSVQLG